MTVRGLTVSFLVLVLAVPDGARAALFISEVMYDAPGSDTGTEWIEVRNDGADAIDLSTLKLADSKGAHKIVPVQGGGAIAAGGYAIIARDPASAAFSGAAAPVFKSAMSLGNMSGTIELRSASGTLDSATYQKAMGAAGDGNTLNRTSASATFAIRIPSPGAAMSATAVEKPAVQSASKASKKQAKKSAAARSVRSQAGSPAVALVAEGESDEPLPAVAGSSTSVIAAQQTSTSYEWPLAAGAIALAAGIGLAASRRAKRDEWTIIDDTPEAA